MPARPFTEDEYTRVIGFLADQRRFRDRLLVISACASGFRIRELLSLRFLQLHDVASGEVAKDVTIPRRDLKGGRGRQKRSVRSRRVPLGESVRAAIADYIAKLTVETVITGRLRSDTDRPRSESTGRIITNASYQHALAGFAKTLVRSGASLGEEKRVKGLRYHALFGSNWAIEVDVKFLLGMRPRWEQPDLDNLWKPFQNALAIPPAGLRLKVRKGTRLYAMFANDRQVTRYGVQMAPFIAASASDDLAIVKVTARPAPSLELVRRS